MFKPPPKLDTKQDIKIFEAGVKRLTGLNWLVVKVDKERELILWELLLPIACGKLKISAQSNLYDAEEIYGFQVESEPSFYMQALKLIEVKK